VGAKSRANGAEEPVLLEEAASPSPDNNVSKSCTAEAAEPIMVPLV
jgi:hypothetical protein